MSDPVPAVAEAGATGEIAAIFADIRSVYRVGVVNLIWRHLATVDGALPWAWGALRPLYVGGQVDREADLLRAALVLPSAVPFPAPVFDALGLGEADLTAIRAVLAAYDRTNAMALVALTALRAAMTGDVGAAASPIAAPAAVFPDIPLPRLLALTEMQPATAELVLLISRFGGRADEPLLASMYRHLAHWPRYLALCWPVLSGLDSQGRLSGAIEAAKALASASRLRVVAEPLAEPARARVDAALARFTDDVIAKMVVICALLRRMTMGG